MILKIESEDLEAIYEKLTKALNEIDLEPGDKHTIYYIRQALEILRSSVTKHHHDVHFI